MKLFNDLSNLTGTNGTTTFADSETQVLIQGNIGDQFYTNGKVITRHNHLATFGQEDFTSNVRSTEVELRTIVILERSMTTTFFFLQNINGGFKLVVRLYRTGFGNNHTATDLILVDTTEEQTYVIASFTFVKNLTEHLNTRNSRFQFLCTHTDDVNGITSVNNTRLNTTSGNSTTTGNREYILDRHEEILINSANRIWNPRVNSSHEFFNVGYTLFFSIQSSESRTTNYRDVVTIIIIGTQKITELHFNEVKQLRIINKVTLVQENNELRNTNLTSQKDMLTSLGHGTVSSSAHEDSTVHLSSTSNHILHIVGVAGTVNVSIVTIFGLILNVSCVNGNTTLFFFGSGVNRIEGFNSLRGYTCLVQYLGNSSGQSGLTVVNVTDSTDIDVRFGSFKLFFCHFNTY